MSDSSMRLQEYLEEAVKDIMEARTNVPANKVFRWINRSAFRQDQAIIVQAMVRRLEPNFPLYEVELHIGVQTKGQEDLGGQRQDLLYAECSGEVHQDMTTVTLQAAVDAAYPSSGITVDGLVPIEPGAGADDEVFLRWEALNAYLTYIQPST